MKRGKELKTSKTENQLLENEQFAKLESLVLRSVVFIIFLLGIILVLAICFKHFYELMRTLW